MLDFSAFPDLLTWRPDTKIFPARWMLIGQFKFPARQPYARLYHDWNSELYCKYDKCLFKQFGSLFQFDGESVLHLDGSDLSIWITQHAALAASYRKLKNHLVFYVNWLLIVYFLYSIKVTVFHQSLVCSHLVINFIITVSLCRPQH